MTPATPSVANRQRDETGRGCRLGRLGERPASTGAAPLRRSRSTSESSRGRAGHPRSVLVEHLCGVHHVGDGLQEHARPRAAGTPGSRRVDRRSSAARGAAGRGRALGRPARPAARRGRTRASSRVALDQAAPRRGRRGDGPHRRVDPGGPVALGPQPKEPTEREAEHRVEHEVRDVGEVRERRLRPSATRTTRRWRRRATYRPNAIASRTHGVTCDGRWARMPIRIATTALTDAVR